MFFVWCIYNPQQTTQCTGGILLILYGLISTSDIIDGWLARRLGQASAFGRLLDHLCDIIFIQSTLATYVRLGQVPWWLPASIAWAFILYLVDSWWRTAGQLRRRLLPTRIGHWGGILYYMTVGIVTVDRYLPNDMTRLLIHLGWFQAMTLLALISGFDRLFCLAFTPRHVSD